MARATIYRTPEDRAIQVEDITFGSGMAAQIIQYALVPEHAYDEVAIARRRTRLLGEIRRGHRYICARDVDSQDFNPATLRGVAHVAPGRSARAVKSTGTAAYLGRFASITFEESGFWPQDRRDDSVAAALLYDATRDLAPQARLRDAGGLQLLAETAGVGMPAIDRAGQMNQALISLNPWLLSGETQ